MHKTWPDTDMTLAAAAAANAMPWQVCSLASSSVPLAAEEEDDEDQDGNEINCISEKFRFSRLSSSFLAFKLAKVKSPSEERKKPGEEASVSFHPQAAEMHVD